MRDILLFMIAFGALPFCVSRPYIGLLFFFWISFMNPHRLTYGAAFDFPFAELAGIATLIGAFYLYFTRQLPRLIPWERESILLVLLFVMFSITSLFSLLPDEAWPDWVQLAKIFLMTMLTLVLIDDERKFKYLVFVVSLSIGFYGIKGGLYSIRTAGQGMVLGPGGTIGDNTALGLALNMVLPMIYMLSVIEKNTWVRIFFFISAGLTFLAIIFTYSRGAWLGLGIVAIALFSTFKFRNRVALGILVFVTLPVAISLLPERAIDRAATLQSYEEDGSAQKRLTAWTTAWNVAVARPLTGGGFGVIDDPEIGKQFNSDFTPGDVGVHSIYFEVLAENGFISFVLFLLLLIFSILSSWKIWRTMNRPETRHLAGYGFMLAVGLFAYSVSGAFLEAAHFDLFYMLVAMTVILKVLTRLRLNIDAHADNVVQCPDRTEWFDGNKVSL